MQKEKADDNVDSGAPTNLLNQKWKLQLNLTDLLLVHESSGIHNLQMFIILINVYDYGKLSSSVTESINGRFSSFYGRNRNEAFDG